MNCVLRPHEKETTEHGVVAPRGPLVFDASIRVLSPRGKGVSSGHFLPVGCDWRHTTTVLKTNQTPFQWSPFSRPASICVLLCEQRLAPFGGWQPNRAPAQVGPSATGRGSGSTFSFWCVKVLIYAPVALGTRQDREILQREPCSYPWRQRGKAPPATGGADFLTSLTKEWNGLSSPSLFLHRDFPLSVLFCNATQARTRKHWCRFLFYSIWKEPVERLCQLLHL